MDNYLLGAAKYFRVADNYFWRWAEGGSVLEWHNGDTICYRNELMELLQPLTTQGLPPIGALLLVLGACKDDWAQQTDRLHILHTIQGTTRWEADKSQYKSLSGEITDGLQLLQHVAQLPKELRSGKARTTLLLMLFATCNDKLESAESKNITDAFNSGQADALVFKKGLQSPARYLQADMRCLQQALAAFPATGSLSLALSTSLQQVPGVAAMEIPAPMSLLQQLEQDNTTSALAQLCRRVMAALNIPMRTHGSSDQLFGGVADITNRGNFDKLLLSELAHDDLSLMARLANNEALYLRREQLPSNLEKQRILLIDTTIKMWGMPRVFAVSAALACAQNNKINARIQSYTLAGNTYTETDLTTKEGVIKTLEQLDAALHCGRALARFMSQPWLHSEDEVFLITEENSLHHTLLLSIIQSLKTPLTYVITVNRQGHLQLYEFVHGRRKLLNQAKFNLQELLFNKPAAPKNPRSLNGWPVIMQQDVFPLYFPGSKIRFTADLFYEVRSSQAICITTDHRVLYWTNKNLGARELMSYIERGRYCFGHDGGDTLYILAYVPAKRCLLYHINTSTREIKEIKLATGFIEVKDMAFDANCFYIQPYNNDMLLVTATTGKILPPSESMKAEGARLMESFHKRIPNLSHIKRLVNYGFTVINTVKKVYINGDGELGFDERHISLRPNSNMILIDHNRSEAHKNMRSWRAREKEVRVNDANPQLKFTCFVFDNGSEILADPRGFLHLRSANNNIPEITIVTVMSKPTACWASDGSVCGEYYFTGVRPEASTGTVSFYNKYIQQFIDEIKAHGTNTTL